VEAPTGTRRLLWLYVLVLVIYALLAGWWVYFFFNQADWIVGHLRSAGGEMPPEQVALLRQVTESTARMFLMESGFLLALLGGSAFFVLRALRRERLLVQQQRNFLSAITHELRSPVASARLYIESLQLGRVEPEKRERYLRHAGEDLRRLTATIDELLEGRALLERGLVVHPEPLDLAEQVRGGLERLGAPHLAAGASLALQAPAPVPAQADPLAVDRILDNLLSNGVKYGGTPARLEVAVRAAGTWAELVVRDHGPGLCGLDPKSLFEPFVRGGDESVRSRPGVGLGLFIVRELARLHGGEVLVEDGLPGGGTQFTVRFPTPAARGAS
jgi:signal transduction histidine kinase